MDPPGNMGWLTRFYRRKGWNINELRSDLLAEFGHHYGHAGMSGIVDLFTALLDKRDMHEQMRAANDDEPDRRADTAKLLLSLTEPEERKGWFSAWHPPTIGPVKPSPFAALLTKYPRIHRQVFRQSMIALHRSGKASGFL